MNVFQFLWHYVRKPKQIGAVAPSSKVLVNSLLAPVDWKKIRTVAEFGPGTGVVTREILKKMRADSSLTVFEVNADFCRLLKTIDDDRLSIRKQSAAMLDFEADVIISSLPMNAFSMQSKQRILKSAVKYLASDGSFVQFQYTRKLEPLLELYFKDIRRNWVPLNIPPAFVYICRK